MSTFTFNPEFGANKAVKTNVKNIQFGDGYSQRVAFGINNKTEEWPLTFAQRTQAEADAIEAFLADKNGVTAFDWTAPGDSSSKKWICQEWNRTIEKANLWTITCTFTRVYES